MQINDAVGNGFACMNLTTNSGEINVDGINVIEDPWGNLYSDTGIITINVNNTLIHTLSNLFAGRRLRQQHGQPLHPAAARPAMGAIALEVNGQRINAFPLFFFCHKIDDVLDELKNKTHNNDHETIHLFIRFYNNLISKEGWLMNSTSLGQGTLSILIRACSISRNGRTPIT